MLVYKDMCFCARSGKCNNEKCRRKITADMINAAITENIPIEYGRFDDCNDFISKCE